MSNLSYPIIRPATQADFDRVNTAAMRFAKRHGIVLYDSATMQASEQVESWLDARIEDSRPHSRRYQMLRQQWLRVFRRAVGEQAAYGFGWGNILGKPQG